MLASLFALSAALAPSLQARAALAGPRPVAQDAGGAVARVSSSPTMRFHQREMAFTTILDEQMCIAKTRQIAEEMCSWTDDDWAFFNARPGCNLRIDAKTSDETQGVVLEFATWGGSRDGALNIVVAPNPSRWALGGKRLVWTTVGSRRFEVEDVLFKLVLEEVRTGELSRSCTLVPNFYPQSWEVARAALLVQNRRYRSQLLAYQDQEMQP